MLCYTLGEWNANIYTLYNQALGAHSLLEPTTEQKDLGILITPEMSSSLHCHKIASNANQVLRRLKCSFKYRAAPSFMILYKTLA